MCAVVSFVLGCAHFTSGFSSAWRLSRLTYKRSFPCALFSLILSSNSPFSLWKPVITQLIIKYFIRYLFRTFNMVTHSLTKVLLWVVTLGLFSLVTATRVDLSDMVPRTITQADGTTSTIYINRRLKFTRGSEGTRPVRLTKRFPFSAGRDEWCGELAQDPTTDFSTSAPLAADCKALANALGNGFWTLQPGDFAGGWARVASSGTCSFAARYADTGSAASPMRIGTNDIRFYTNRYAVLEQSGKLGLQGTVQCSNNERMLFVTWGLIHS